MLEQNVFELGTILLKTQLSEINSAEFAAASVRREGETIILQKTGKFWNRQNIWDRPDGLVIVTNYRLAFLSQVKSFTVTTDFLSFPLELVADLRTTRVMLISPAIEFKVAGKLYVFTVISNAGAIVEAIENVTKKL